MEDPTAHLLGDIARECAIRDAYAQRLSEFRPDERLLETEYTFHGTKIRADMRTVDRDSVVRVWEFKIVAEYRGLGQALSYWGQERIDAQLQRPVKGVLAAFVFRPEIVRAVESLNIGLELVTIPPKLRAAGLVPANSPAIAIPILFIPRFPEPPTADN
ncbi:hypothetical protein [Nocardia gipuzkoensis]|uniref:hypothetical protein n=1 Tax=Nocardia gipuzkoensis TaxID=2749991 RepID=UPI003EE014C4